VDKGEILIPECLCNDKKEPSRAFTYRYNAMNKDSNIIVCVLEDGFGRVIQKQSRMKVFHPENVNESVLYEEPGTNFVADAFRFYDESGRLRAITKPIISRKNEVNDVKILTEISNLTAIEYDLLDRKTKISSSVGDSLVYSYSEDNGKLIVNSDAEYHYTADGKLLLRKTKDGYSESFAYDLYGRITNVERDGVSMRREYDGLGRLIQVLDSATGKVSFSYDESGNLAKKQGPKEDDIVEYKYQFNQLTDVIYPNSPAENLHFVYGDKNAPHNRVGLVSLATDATGVHEFYYGRQGEISKVRTSVIIPDGPVETYVTQTEYD
jgi:YD repeat-containing protein